MSDYMKREYDEWCTDCKEYDKDKHCCPRWNKVIRDTVDEIRQNAEMVEVIRCKDCRYALRNLVKRDKDIVICDMHGAYRKIDDYCSYGERAEE